MSASLGRVVVRGDRDERGFGATGEECVCVDVCVFVCVDVCVRGCDRRVCVDVCVRVRVFSNLVSIALMLSKPDAH